MITPVTTLIDIGCDHGKLCYEVIKNKLCDKVTACDISLPSLNKAKELLKDLNVSFICADGNDALKNGSYECVAICGMGGREIARIIGESVNPLLILQPQHDAAFLREFLCLNGYAITDDRVCVDSGRYYDVIKAVRGEQNLSETELNFGANVFKVKNAVLTEKLSKLKTLISGFKKTSKNKRKLDMIEEVLSWQTSQ